MTIANKGVPGRFLILGWINELDTSWAFIWVGGNNNSSAILSYFIYTPSIIPYFPHTL